ncbi:MAG: nucleotidyltransferase domain-containing protein [Candidatus Heimdallarchaeota archaeon]
MSNKLDYFLEPQLLIELIQENLRKIERDGVRIFIIGSLARRDFMIDSDVDILLITGLKEIVIQIRSILDKILLGKGIFYDLITLTSTEFEKRKNTLLIQEALNEGIEI